MRFIFTASIQVAKIFLIGLISFLPFQSVVSAEIISATSTSEIVDRVSQDGLIYLGERHDSQEIHQQQLEIIKQLQQNSNSQTDMAFAKHIQRVIAWEMFQRPFQPMLDRYIAGTITETQLREQTEYDTRWGFDWEFYAPILRYAKEQQIPLIAMNTPEEITQKVAQSGIDSLEGSDYRYIPPIEDIDLSNTEYRQRLQDIYEQHVEYGQGNSTDADNFFAAQVLWDETMAEAIALYYQQHPNSQIIVLVGQAHVMYDYAIPDRVARRIGNPDFSQTTILLDEQQ